MAAYLFRWDQDHVSVVVASNRTAALAALDEIGDPSGGRLEPLVGGDAVLTFALDEDGELTLAPDDWQDSTLHQLTVKLSATRSPATPSNILAADE